MVPDARARRDLEEIFRAAVAAVNPATLVERYLREHLQPAADDRWIVVGAGKAAARMASGCETALGAQRLRGAVIVTDGSECALAALEVYRAAHPLPDQRGMAATRQLCQIVAAAAHPERIICLISGGASSLLVDPLPPVTLAQTVEVDRLLLASGADIHEVNTVRKHLSAVKGGGLLRRGQARPLTTLAISDVVGDDPSVIGSGPTTPDPSTFADALRVLAHYDLTERLPSSVRSLLERGVAGQVPETVKPGDPCTRDVLTSVVGNNHMALVAAAEAARRLGYEPLLAAAPLVGETSTAARRWAQDACLRVAGLHRCAIAGGETTVTVRGHGQGGRNQEFALALAAPLDGLPVAVLSAGTDGIDGPTDAAGAFVDGHTLRRARAIGIDPAAALSRNDSYRFFKKIGGIFRCGPTGTNVMDIKLAIGVPSST